MHLSPKNINFNNIAGKMILHLKIKIVYMDYNPHARTSIATCF